MLTPDDDRLNSWGVSLMLDRANSVISARYGGKRGLLRHIAARLQQVSSGFRALRSVDWAEVGLDRTADPAGHARRTAA